MTILLLAFLSFLPLSPSAWADHQGTELAERNGLWYYQSHDDPVNGRVMEWYSNGQVRAEQNYKDGKRDGIFTEWDEQGNIIKQTTYKNGVEVP